MIKKMKTTNEIRKKAIDLLAKYKEEEVRENLVSIYERKLEEFIGDFWNYSYLDRQEIVEIQKGFFANL